MRRIKSYQDLIVWQKSMSFVTEIYSSTRKFPTEEKFGIVSKLNRASVFIPTNIAEGWGIETSRNYLQFLRTARGSVMEVQTPLIISKHLNYISVEDFENLYNTVVEVGKILQDLIKSINEKLIHLLRFSPLAIHPSLCTN